MIADSASKTWANLMRCMGLQGAPVELESVCRTVDGMYIGQVAGDVGYNAFIGKPSQVHEGPGLEQSRGVWDSLTPNERTAVLQLAASPGDGTPIPLQREFGIGGEHAHCWNCGQDIPEADFPEHCNRCP